MAHIISKRGVYDDSAFDGYRVIAEPLAARESRVFDRRDGGAGTCYRAYSLRLAKAERGGDLFILVRHGGGCEIVAWRGCYNCHEFEETLLALPERVLYSLLFGVYQTARDCTDTARKETAQRWAQAFADNRIRRKRGSKRDGRGPSVYIEEPTNDGAVRQTTN